MTFAIITHVVHYPNDGKLYAYGPYVREMNIWAKHVNKLVIVAPIKKGGSAEINLPYDHAQIRVLKIPIISLTSFAEVIRTMILSPFIFIQIFRAMLMSNHIHLRCPGNIGLMACLVQVLFPKKPKTAKYAGNWDPEAKQPRSYRFQKWLLSNTFWTKNMNALVYGDWPNQSKNIKPFFTATYPRSKIVGIRKRSFSSPFKFLFVGTLSPGKRPLYCSQLVEALQKKGIDATLDFYGDGVERGALEDYIQNRNLNDTMVLHGNQTSEIIQKAFVKSDFLLLPSKSEGWPKVVAESMFWGCVPIATKVSCLSWMLDGGNRGILLDAELINDVTQIEAAVLNLNNLEKMSIDAQKWSQQYTLDYFESEIKKLLS